MKNTASHRVIRIDQETAAVLCGILQNVGGSPAGPRGLMDRLGHEIRGVWGFGTLVGREYVKKRDISDAIWLVDSLFSVGQFEMTTIEPPPYVRPGCPWFGVRRVSSGVMHGAFPHEAEAAAFLKKLEQENQEDKS